MRIAIPTESGKLCSHFGHCEAFAIFEVEASKIVKHEFVDPPHHEPGSHPAFLKELNCTVVLAGGMGQKAQDLMAANGIKTLVGCPEMPLEELVQCYLDGKLQSGSNLCDH